MQTCYSAQHTVAASRERKSSARRADKERHGSRREKLSNFPFFFSLRLLPTRNVGHHRPRRQSWRLLCFCSDYRQGKTVPSRSFSRSDARFRLQEGLADALVNEDGDRQIAQAISFNGDEEVSLLLFSRCIPAQQTAMSSTLEIQQSINSSATQKTQSSIFATTLEKGVLLT
jgi:hypothetical protein